MTDNTPQRLDRIEAALEHTTANLDQLTVKVDQIAEETRTFQLVVRGAITAQQDQIAENSRQIAVLITAVQKHDAAIANLEQQWQAYLRRLPPQ